MAGAVVHGQAAALHALSTAAESSKRLSQQQKRLELEEEVSSLSKKLDREERMHQVLEIALRSPRGSAVEIPSFLPQKLIQSLQTKELLAELVMVEEEISRLERELSRIQLQGLTASQVTAERAPETALYKYVRDNIIPPADHPIENQQTEQKTLPLEETKPMFFINQAMKGDYAAVRALNGKTRPASLGGAADKKERPWVSLREGKAAAKSELKEKLNSDHSPEQPASNKHVPKQIGSFKFFKDPPLSFSSSSSGKNNQILQPNKLSERIMKCLICIFLRMMRISRSMELEKSSITTRIHLAGSSGMSLKPSLTMQRETGRQDPYAIFEIEGSILRDIGPYKNLVRFTSTSMDARGLSNSMPLLRKLGALMNSLQDADPRFLTHPQKLAFWINMYNACIMNGFLEHGLPSSPDKVLALRNKAVIHVGGNKLSARTIECSILGQSTDSKEDISAVWRSQRLEKAETNIVFALCCGTRSSPAVRIYTADGVDAELEKAKLEYLQASIVVTEARKLMIPKLLSSNLHLSAEDDEALAGWICSQLPTSWSLRRSMTECSRALNRKKPTEILDVMPYEYEFQYLFFM